MSESFLDGKVTLHRGDCLDVLPLLEENSVDSCVTDPPYHLTSIVKRFGSETAAPCQIGKTGAYARASKGFMGKQWDGGDIAFRPEVWAEVLRVLKPGGHLLAFSGTRTYHRMACAIEDAGFEIRDQIGWCYGSGFPKSHDVSKGIDRMAGAELEVIGNSQWHGRNPNGRKAKGEDRVYGVDTRTDDECNIVTAPATEAAIQWQGWGTALKPAWEPICLARKPLSESSIATNVLEWGTGGINVDGCRIGIDASDDIYAKNPHTTNQASNQIYGAFKAGSEYKVPQGRWPANLIHDGSEEVLAGFPESDHARGNTSPTKRSTSIFNSCVESQGAISGGDTGSAARFFYTAKADSNDRLGSNHPTVKPVDLIQYLTRLVTPRGGRILDPFAGTGTTGEAGFIEGFNVTLIEREPEYQADIVKRMGLCLSGPEERRAASVKQLPPDDLPMFGGLI